MKILKRATLVILLVIQVIHIYCQQSSTTEIYTKTIDAIIEHSQLNLQGKPVLILAAKFYEKNIKTYKGKNRIKYISGFKGQGKELKGGEFAYLNLSPITVSDSRLIVLTTKSKVTYKSKNNWKLDNENKAYYYAIFEFNKETEEYQMKELIEGKFCPDTIN